MVASIHGSSTESDVVGVGPVGGVVDFLDGAVAEVDFVDDARRGGDEVEIVLAGQALLDDLEVEEAEEAAAEAEAEGGAGLHLEAEGGVVEAELVEAVAELLEVGGVDREQAAEDDRLDELEAGEGLRRGLAGIGDGVADAGLGDFLDLRGDEADLAGAELRELLDLGAEAADAVDEVGGAGGHELDLLALAAGAVDDADEDDDAEIGVVPAVDEHGLQGGAGVALGGRDVGDDGVEHLLDADAGLGAGEHRAGGVEADDLLDLLPHALGIGGGEVDLVDDGHDLVVVLDRLVDVGQRLGFDALGGVDDEERAFARGEAARDLVGEVDVAGGVHEVELIALPLEADGLRLDRDPALALDVHIVEHLRVATHLARRQPAGGLDQPVGKRRLPVVDMGDDREVPDPRSVSHRGGR